MLAQEQELFSKTARLFNPIRHFPHLPIVDHAILQAANLSNQAQAELEELNLRSFVHKVGHGISTVAHNPIVQAAAKAGVNAALDKYTEEELQELSILSSIKHGVSHVAHNPIVQAAAHAAAQAAVDKYLHEEQLEELSLRSLVHKVSHNSIVQAAAKAAAQAAADKYLHEELMELKFGSKFKHAMKKVGSGIKKVFNDPTVQAIVTTGIDIASNVPEEQLEELWQESDGFYVPKKINPDEYISLPNGFQELRLLSQARRDQIKHNLGRVGSGVKKVVQNPIFQKVVETGALVALGEEELEELNLASLIRKYGKPVHSSTKVAVLRTPAYYNNDAITLV